MCGAAPLGLGGSLSLQLYCNPFPAVLLLEYTQVGSTIIRLYIQGGVLCSMMLPCGLTVHYLELTQGKLSYAQLCIY
eukprot:6598524-Prymnesium_polylepis.1